MHLTPDDRQLIGDSLQRLCRDLSRQLFERPEHPCPPAALDAACAQLAAQGVLNTGDEPGCGLWEGEDDAAHLALTLDSLATLGETNAALAFRLHRAALARYLLARLGLPLAGAEDLALCLHGRHGIGRGELARWWRGRDADVGLLADVFDDKRSRLALMPDKTSGVLCPVFAGDTLQWWRCEAPPLTDDGHGLDELRTGTVLVAGGTPLPRLDPAQAPAVSRALWHREWLGLLAIQLGVARHAAAKARDYAALRFQGGDLIDRHPAVQILLAGIRAALADSAAFLHAQSLDDAGFGTLLLSRNRLQEALAEAASSAMQVFGGIGYMRDNGLEKCFRDIHQLRHQSGGPLDMPLLAAHWEDLP